MRVFVVLLLCLALASCASHSPQIRVVQAAAPALASRHSFQLLPPEQALSGELPLREQYAQLEPLLRQGLAERGYHESPQPELRVYYWLALHDTPLEFRVDTPPPNPLGAYQAIHRLHDETGTLRLRLTDLNGQVLWEGLASTGLSPAWDSTEQLQSAVAALLQQIPVAH
ncbi:DUF4136 domain-containing protein [Pseudomonas sp. 2FG]|uniref:DUF4136 domain-containing protein n=1 Tax=Pseudomonas sp. 2FG TaxID=2502191 RepID=UPI0010F75054|nr:DUF4136 domain-containing protein [Pseudomonas sp. 2FG]